jgi:hypothetical protein
MPYCCGEQGDVQRHDPLAQDGAGLQGEPAIPTIPTGRARPLREAGKKVGACVWACVRKEGLGGRWKLFG